MGMLCYSVFKEQKRDFSPSLFLHNTKRLKRNALKKIFYEFLKLLLVFADNLLGYAVLFCHCRCAGFLFSGEIIRQQIRSPWFPRKKLLFQLVHDHFTDYSGFHIFRTTQALQKCNVIGLVQNGVQ